MGVTIHSSTSPCGNDPEKLRERLDEIQLCETFNDEFSSGIESPRRTRLLERLRTVLRAMRDCLLDLKAVVQGERSPVKAPANANAVGTGASAPPPLRT